MPPNTYPHVKHLTGPILETMGRAARPEGVLKGIECDLDNLIKSGLSAASPDELAEVETLLADMHRRVFLALNFINADALENPRPFYTKADR